MKAITKMLNCTQLIIKGAGDLASGVALRLFKAGYRFIMTELAQPTAIRTTVSFAQSIYEGQMEIEGVCAQKATEENAAKLLAADIIPVLGTPACGWLNSLQPQALIEATLAKKNTDLSKNEKFYTIALGPGFVAGRDCDVVVETARGHFLGSLIYDGSASPNTGKPGNIGGFDLERVLRAPAPGVISFTAKIGDTVLAGDILGQAGEQPIIATISGVLRGALPTGLSVPQGFKIGDIDPRPEAVKFIHSPSDKARAIAGAVLEALLARKIFPLK